MNDLIFVFFRLWGILHQYREHLLKKKSLGYIWICACIYKHTFINLKILYVNIDIYN